METLKNLSTSSIKSVLKVPLSLLKPEKFDFAKKHSDPGEAPGIENRKDVRESPDSGEILIRSIKFSESEFVEKSYEHIDTFLSSEPSVSDGFRWINVDGVNPYVINRLREHYELHTLAAEDALHVPQRPKFEDYGGQLFIVMRMLVSQHEAIRNEQVSFFQLKDTLITIQETPGDIWCKVRERMKKPGSRFRTLGNDYLLYTLIDAIIDHIFPLLENYGELLDELELKLLKESKNDLQQQIHQIRRELSFYRRIVVPTREVLYELHQDKEENFNDLVAPFFGDVYDHTRQLLDAIDSYREMASGLNDLYKSTVTDSLNETMKVLTVMASFFIPLTFLSSVYGMNFDYMPELNWVYAYPVFWITCVIGTIAMWWYFRHKGWLGK